MKTLYKKIGNYFFEEDECPNWWIPVMLLPIISIIIVEIFA